MWSNLHQHGLELLHFWTDVADLVLLQDCHHQQLLRVQQVAETGPGHFDELGEPLLVDPGG